MPCQQGVTATSKPSRSQHLDEIRTPGPARRAHRNGAKAGARRVPRAGSCGCASQSPGRACGSARAAGPPAPRSRARRAARPAQAGRGHRPARRVAFRHFGGAVQVGEHGREGKSAGGPLRLTQMSAGGGRSRRPLAPGRRAATASKAGRARSQYRPRRRDPAPAAGPLGARDHASICWRRSAAPRDRSAHTGPRLPGTACDDRASGGSMLPQTGKGQRQSRLDVGFVSNGPDWPGFQFRRISLMPGRPPSRAGISR